MAALQHSAQATTASAEGYRQAVLSEDDVKLYSVLSEDESQAMLVGTGSS